MSDALTELETMQCARCLDRVPVGRYCINCGALHPEDGVAETAPAGRFRRSRPVNTLTLAPGQVDRPRSSEEEIAARRSVRRLALLRIVLVVLPLTILVVVIARLGADMLTEEIPPPAASEPKVTCWNGDVEVAAACPEPTGPAGLQWVFPSFKPGTGGCVGLVATNPRFTRPQMWVCDVEFGERVIQVTYSQIESVKETKRFFDNTYGARNRRVVGDRYLYKAPGRSGEGASLYLDRPFSVTIKASGTLDRDRALAKLVQFRPVGQFNVRPDDVV